MTENLNFTEAEVQQMLDNLDSFSPEEVQEIDKLVDELGKRNTQSQCMMIL